MYAIYYPIPLYIQPRHPYDGGFFFKPGTPSYDGGFFIVVMRRRDYPIKLAVPFGQDRLIC
jgi:hypothetical protein